MNRLFPTLVSVCLITGILNLSGCVTARRYDDMAARAKRSTETAANAEKELATLKDERARQDSLMKHLTSDVTRLRKDSTQLSDLYARNKELMDDLFEKYDRLDKSYNDLLANSESQASDLTKNLTEKERELQAREKRLQEMGQIIADKERVVTELRNKVNNALLSFKPGELSVDIKNGQVYVSLSEKLLFKSGSYTVDPNGANALKKLAEVLKNQPDINVKVEGHTDDVPVAKNAASGMDDNWDLSVLRATSIVNVLTKAGLPPERLTAAGRGEFAPVAVGKTPEDRQKNRRTEVILTPKLDELYQLLEVKSN